MLEKMRKQKQKKNVKIVIGLGIFILLFVIGGIIWLVNQPKQKPEQVLTSYINCLNEQNYEGMYQFLSESSKNKITQEDFVKRNQNIYEGIDACDVKIEIKEIQKEKEVSKLSYHESMSTSAGTIEFDHTAKLMKEDKEYRIEWSSSYIFPQLRDTDKVRVSTIPSTRGEILDRGGVKLAENGKISSVGIVPGKLGEEKAQNIQAISEITGVSTDYIEKQISASYVKEDTFVPIKKIADSDQEKKNKLLQIPGVMINKVKARVYPLGKEAGHLIGYVQPINREELEANSGKGYNSSSIIGKAGLEQAYEDRLRGIDGTEIYIADSEGKKIKELAKQDKKDGEDIKLTLDSQMQKTIYEQMKDDKGLFVVMEPTTGELLATVSTPTFDANDFVTGLTNSEWDELNNDPSKPLYNRFTQSYCPGSTFKPVTGAIGLTTGKINPSEDYGYTGTSWQKDKSWGNYQITTLTGYNGAKNLANALMYSDNIYFAQSALKIGADTLAESLNQLGFNESIEFPLTLKKSQYANQNGTKIEGETKLADSGYGQGSILVNPIHMASIYSAFANEGDMIKPYIEYRKDRTPEIAKERAFTKEAANTIKKDLIQVVENPNGTAHDMKIAGVTIAGKTGTAELKQSSDDKDSGTLGWFNCFTIDRTGQNDLLVVSMVENIQNNSDGGSHYLIQKIRKLF